MALVVGDEGEVGLGWGGRLLPAPACHRGEQRKDATRQVTGGVAQAQRIKSGGATIAIHDEL